MCSKMLVQNQLRVWTNVCTHERGCRSDSTPSRGECTFDNLPTVPGTYAYAQPFCIFSYVLAFSDVGDVHTDMTRM